MAVSLSQCQSIVATNLAELTKLASSGDSTQYASLGLAIDGMLSAVEATGDTTLFQTAISLCQQMQGHTTPVMLNGVTYQVFGPLTNGMPSQIETWQALCPFFRLGSVMMEKQQTLLSYASEVSSLVFFARQMLLGLWFDPKVGWYPTKYPNLGSGSTQIPWVLPSLGGWGNKTTNEPAYPLLMDPCTLLGICCERLATYNGDATAIDFAYRIAENMGGHFTYLNGGWVWDLQEDHEPDLSHANRVPTFVLESTYFGSEDAQNLAMTILNCTDLTQGWNNLAFYNSIDGTNGPCGQGALPYQLGTPYFGWARLGAINPTVQAVMEQALAISLAGPKPGINMGNYNFGAIAQVGYAGNLVRA